MSSTSAGPVYAPVGCIMLALTEGCNLRCTYCFVNKKTRRMSAETARKTVDFLVHREISGYERQVHVSFFGGEPFLELDLMEEVIRYAREPRPGPRKHIAFSATTNGTICSPRVERIVKDGQMSIMLSLDGDRDASRHRPFVSSRESYALVARNLRRFAGWAPELHVRMTFHPDALDLVGNVRHALELGAPSIALCPVVEADWQGHEEGLETAYQALADWYVEQVRREAPPPLIITNVMLRQLHRARAGAPRPARSCAVGTSLLGVDPDGHVMPCHRFLYRRHDWLGSVDRPHLSDARWQYVHLSSRDILGCAGCVAEPVCGGGCPVVALEAGRGLNGAHPAYCMLTRAHVRAVLRIYETLQSEPGTVFSHLLDGSLELSPAMQELATR